MTLIFEAMESTKLHSGPIKANLKAGTSVIGQTVTEDSACS